MNAAPPIKQQTNEGHGFTIDTSRAPDVVVVSTFGALDQKRFQGMLNSLSMAMDQIVGAGRAFCPIVFDMSCSRLAADMNLPAFRDAEKPLLRRYRDVALVASNVTQTDLFNFLITVFTALAPGTRRADSLEQAVQMVTKGAIRAAHLTAEELA